MEKTQDTGIHYNFVKPHQALDNQTPAKVAGIEIKDKNKWRSAFESNMS